MTFVQARNAIIDGLEAHLRCPVVLSDQIGDMPEFPYCYYSVLTPRASNHVFGLIGVQGSEKEGFKRLRSEPVTATMSFTFCGQNRKTEDGDYVSGEDEALELSEKARGFFLLNGHNIVTEYGDVVVNNVGSVVNRTGFVVEDTIRRYGFDIRLSYVRTDEMPTVTIKKPGSFIGSPHS